MVVNKLITVNFIGRIHELSEKRDKKFGSSSSEENDKDGRNKTEINPGNKIHRKREAGFEKEHVKQPFLVLLFLTNSMI